MNLLPGFFSLSFFSHFFSVIPKLNCVFTVEIDGFISYIYGSKFQLRQVSGLQKSSKPREQLTCELLLPKGLFMPAKDWKHPPFREEMVRPVLVIDHFQPV